MTSFSVNFGQCAARISACVQPPTQRAQSATTRRSAVCHAQSHSLSNGKSQWGSSREISTQRTSAVMEDSFGGNVAEMPQPEVKIDNVTDPFATVVTVKFGDVLGDLLDTMSSLKNLGLNIVKAKIDMEDKKKNKFYITDAKSGEKILDEERLEEIRMTIINNMIIYHPEAVQELATGFGKRVKDFATKLGANANAKIPTSIMMLPSDDGMRTVLEISTTDRPGLLVDIVGTLKDVNVEVLSAKVETLGDMAHDVLAITYHGEPLNRPMETLVENALFYYLAIGDVEKEESY